MAASTVEVIIKGTDNVSGVLSGIQGELARLKESAGAAAVAFGAIGAAGIALIGTLVMTAARTEELGVVVDNLGRVAGYSSEELAGVEQGIMELGITTQAAREIMARFMGAELDLADASKIARAAQDLAVIGMENSSEAAANLTYAIAAMQPRILRQYGLFINLNDVYEKAALALGKDVTALTEAEKRQGMLNAVLEAAASYTGTYEAAMETASKQIRSFPRYVEELANSLGEFFLPMLGEAVEVLTEAVKWFLALPDPVKQVSMQILAMGTAGSVAVASLAGVVLLLPQLATAVSFLLSPLGLAAAAVGVFAAAWATNFMGIQDTLRPVIDGLGNLVTSIIGQVTPALSGFASFVTSNLTPILAGFAAAILYVVVPAFITWAATAGTAAAATIAALLPVVAPIAAIGVAAGLLAAAWESNFGGIQDKTQGVFDFIQPYIETAMTAVQTAISTVLTNVRSWWDENHEAIQTTVETVWGVVQAFIDTTMANIQTVIDSALQTVRGWWEENHELIRSTAETVWEAIRSLIEIATTAIQSIIESVLGIVRGWWEENHELIRATTERIWGWISGFIDTTLNAILTVVEAILEGIRAFWEDHGERIKAIVQSTWDIIKTYIETMINTILGIIKAVMQLITGDWKGAWETIKGVGETIWQGIKSIVESAINIVKNTVEIVMTTLQSIWTRLWDAIETKVTGIWEGIKTAVTTKVQEIKTVVETWLNNTVTAITGMVGAFVQGGKDLIGGLIGGVKAMAGAVVDAVKGVINDAISAAKRLLGIGSPSTVFIEIGKALMAGLELGIGEGEAGVLERLGGVMSGLGRGFEAMIAGMQALAGWEGIGEWTFVAGYVIPALENFKRDLKLVIEALGEVADELGPTVVDAADRVAEVIGEIGRALSSITEGLAALGGYTGIGEWTFVAGYVLPALDALKRDLIAVVNMLAQVGEDVAGAVPRAKAFAKDVADILSNIATGVEALNTLQGMGTAEPYNLIEAGKNLLKSLADGFVQACQDEWGRISAAVYKLVNDLSLYVDTVLGPIMEAAGDLLGLDFIGGWIAGLKENEGALYTAIIAIVNNAVAEANRMLRDMHVAGESLGRDFISGWIDGLWNSAGRLYQVIRDIVTRAIAEANDAAGTASPSKLMFDLGSQMAAGLAGGLSANALAPAVAMGRLVGATAQPARTPATPTQTRGVETSGATRWDNVTVNVNTLEPAPIARQIERTLRRLSLQAELSASRG